MSRREEKLDRELRFHLEQHIEDLVARGVPREEAKRQAQLALGGLEPVREQCREARPLWWLERLAADTRHTLRSMRRSPAWALTLVATVAVCVAVNTAVFTVVDSLLLRPLPFPGADRLVAVTNLYPKAGIIDQDNSAAGDLADRRAGVPGLAEHALLQRISRPVERSGPPTQLDGLAVTPSLFPLLRATAGEGRLLHEGEMELGKHRVVILTHGLRRELFGSTPAVGETVRINGEPHNVAGVLPAGFRFLGPEVRFFVPLALTPEDWKGHHSNNYQYIARLRDGASVAQVQAQLDVLNRQLLDVYPAFKELLLNAGFYSRVEPYQPWLMRRARPSLNLLWAGALLVLVIGAANLAGISLARAAGRAREGATRVALGASRADMARQCLLESLVPALIGCALGIAGAFAALAVLDRTLLPAAVEIGPSRWVMLYALAAAVLIGLASGLASLLQISGRHREPALALRDGSRTMTSRSGTLVRRALVAVQVALAFVLLNGAGVLVASLRELNTVRPGFEIENVWTAGTYLPAASYREGADLRRAADRILAAARETPGITLAALGDSVPFRGNFNDSVILAEGYTMKPGESAISPIQVRATPGYFETLGIPVVAGRAFNDRDDGRFPVIIIDEKLAQRFFGHHDCVGRRMYFPNPGEAPEYMTIVGVARSVRLENLAGTGNPNGVYYRPWQPNPTRSLSMVWRGPAAAVDAFRTRFQQTVPGVAFFDLHSLAERRELTLTSRRFAQALVLIFAGVAVALAAIGIYGLLAFLLSQRRREVGVRVALGCSPQAIFGLFVRDGLVLVAAGLLVGTLGAFMAKAWVDGQLYGVSALDLRVAIPVAAVLLAVTFAGILIPAWRASQVDPAIVLREG